MIIEDVRAIYPNYRQQLSEWRSHLWQIVVRIETDVGITGWGYGGGGLASVAIVNHHLADLLVGRSLDSTESMPVFSGFPLHSTAFRGA